MKGVKILPKHLPPRDKNPKNKKDFKYIPKKIFQTWETNQVTPGMYDAVHTWIDKNPDWEYHFFDKDDRRNFIKDNFPKKVLDAYDALIPGSYKSDLFRFCVLYIEGGVYADIKAILLESLSDIIPSDVSFIAFKDRSFYGMEFDGYIFTTPLISKKRHLFFKKAIDLIVCNCRKGFYGNDPLSPTGPGLLGKALNISLNLNENSIFTVGKHCKGNMKYELWPIPNYRNNTMYSLKGVAFIKIEYPGYRQEQSICFNKDVSFKYQYCWYNNKVYTHGKVIRTTPEKVFKKRLKKELAGGVVRMYKSGDKKSARKEIMRIIKSGNFCFRLCEALVSYEIVKPIKIIFRRR